MDAPFDRTLFPGITDTVPEPGFEESYSLINEECTNR